MTERKEPANKRDMEDEWISIRGARQHNLKNIDLRIPRNRFVVITGVSGSGKSSLAFDTLFAEGQRRYLEALSTYGRQTLGRLNAPDVDSIEGLSPSIAIEQKGLPHNPRSTVGTLTEIHDYLRLLFARLGTPYCPRCNLPIRAWTIPQMTQDIFAALPERSRLLILAPLGDVPESEMPNLVRRLRRDGFGRVRANSTVYELDPLPAFPRRPSHRVEIVIDRLVIEKEKKRRLVDALELALNVGKGTAGFATLEGAEKFYSQTARCPECGYTAPEQKPALFSFQHPSGMCPSCGGLGYRGSEEEARESESDFFDEGEQALPRFASNLPPCADCGGTRLNLAARSVRLGGFSIDQVSSMIPSDVARWITNIEPEASRDAILDRPRKEILKRLNTLIQTGLSYLTLGRASNTLSGGEAQRVRLVHQIGGALSGVLYVLDEPSIGLHPKDHARLLKILMKLRDDGNSLVVVEHDRETILASDYLVDMGPGAGAQGGEVVYTGAPEGVKANPSSLTGLYLSGEKRISVPKRRKKASEFFRLTGAAGNNLKDLSVDFPYGLMTCVTGVSGSGKSTLVIDTLYRALYGRIYNIDTHPTPFQSLENAERLNKVILVDQAPLGKTPRSTPATYTGVFALIRRLFARAPEARARGYSPARFSFNVKGGRCETCKGEGLQKIEMYFLPDVYVTCPACEGSRYNLETSEIKYRGESIASILDMTVYEAAVFFENFRPIRQKLDTLIEVGMGYVKLGQPAPTLSGGEAQRVKLATELSRRGQGKALYILDEPTTGLHFDDINKLLHVLRKLVEQGNTIIVIEHHPDVIKTADYVIDLGPEAGDGGGRIVATGTPEEVSRSKVSHTAAFLREALGPKLSK